MTRTLMCRRPSDHAKHCPAAKRLRRSLTLRMYRDGLTYQAISAAMGYANSNSVIQIVKRSGVALRGRGNRKAAVSVDPATGAVIKRYAPINECTKDGFTLSQVYQLIGTHKTYKGLLWRSA